VPNCAATDAANLDGALLLAEGIELARDVSPNAKLWFKLRVAAARDIEAAGLCGVTYLDASGIEVPLPYPGLQPNGQIAAAVPFAASRKPQGRVTVIALRPPSGAVRIRLRFVPNSADDILRIRIEPMPGQSTIVRPMK
jgi:hypothetical protein